MSNVPPFPARAVRRTSSPVIKSRSRFRWQARRGSLIAITGQVGRLTRGDTGTAVDANGVTYTAPYGAPRLEMRDFAGSGTRRELGVRLSNDDLEWDYNGVPETGTLLFEFSENGTGTTLNAGLVYLGNDAATDARLWVQSDGSHYQATVHNGAESASVTLTTVAPATGDSVRGVVQLDDDGTDWRIRLWVDAIHTADEEISAWSSAISRAATWGADTKIRANRVGSAGTQGSTWLRQLAWDAGLWSIDDMLARM